MKWPPIEVPGLRGRVLAFAVPIVLLALLAIGYAGVERSRIAFEQNDARALRLLRGLSATAAVVGPDRPEPLQQMLQQLVGPGSPVRNAWMITEKQVGAFVFQKARTYAVHSDPALVSAKLDKDLASDKQANDLSKVVEVRFEKHATDRPDLTFVVNRSADQRTVEVAGPVVQGGKLVGTFGLNLAFERPEAPLPWGAVALIVLTALALVTVIFRFMPGSALAGFFAGIVVLAVGAGLYSQVGAVVRSSEAYASARTMVDAAALHDAAPASLPREALASAIADVPGPGRKVERVWSIDRGPRSPSELLALTPAQLPAPGAVVGWTKVALGPDKLVDNASLGRLFNRITVTSVVLVLLFLLGFVGWLRQLGHTLRVHAYAYGYAAPAMVGMLLFVFFPFVSGFIFSFFENVTGDDLAGTVNMFGMNFRVMGLTNFFDILGSREYPITDARNFYFTLVVTLLWTISNVALHVTLGLALALLLKNAWLRCKGIYRVLLIVPWAVPNYITALIWRGMFDVEFGTINFLLEAVGIGKVAWWSSFWTAFAANLTTNVWLGFPFMMVISLGALQSIPADLYEAAEVDGASRWQQFRQITLPLLKPALFPAIMLGVIWTFNMFNVIYLVSGGAPERKTDILITQAYRFAFEGARRYGYAAAYAVIIFGILLAYGLLSNRVTKASEGAFD